MTGNTLDKPSLLLKRAYVKDTNFERKLKGSSGSEQTRNLGCPSK